MSGVMEHQLGDLLIRSSIWVALAFYGLALATLIAYSSASRPARWFWTVACAVYLIHVGLAFHYFHGWSHEHAVEHTRAVSGVGSGIYFSHLFTLVWTADVAYWWLRPDQHRQRALWITRLLHGYILFIIFNGAVIFAEGEVRWVSLIGFVILGLWWLVRRNAAVGAPSA